MTDVDFEVIGPYVVALLMSIGAVFIFIWAVLSGAFNGADEEALRFYHREVDDDGPATRLTRTPRCIPRRRTRVRTTKWRNMPAAISRRVSVIFRLGCWPSTRCFSSGPSITASNIWGGLGPGRPGSW